MNKLNNEMREMEISESKNDKNILISESKYDKDILFNDNKNIDNVKNDVFYDLNNNSNNNSKIKATRIFSLEAKLLEPPRKFNNNNASNDNNNYNNANINTTNTTNNINDRKIIERPSISIYRPGSSSGRPGSSNGRPGSASSSSSRNLSSTTLSSSISNSNRFGVLDSVIDSVSTKLAMRNAIQMEACSDSLLRIMNETEEQNSHDLIMFAENGNVAGLIDYIELNNISNLNNIKGMSGFTLLHHACNRGHMLMVFELIKAKINVLATNDSGETALHLAAYSGNLLVVEQLIDSGIDINSQNNYGETCLTYAARKSMPALVRLLLQRGANKDIEDRFGDSPAEHAIDDHTLRAFETKYLDVFNNQGAFPFKALLCVFSYLSVKEVCRAACVSGKWHRISEDDSIWKRLGIRRWEAALQSSLGFAAPASMSFRPKKKIIKEKDRIPSR